MIGQAVVITEPARPDPWLTPKVGMCGIVTWSAENVAPGHWHVRFDDGITRVMPESVLSVVLAPVQEPEPTPEPVAAQESEPEPDVVEDAAPKAGICVGAVVKVKASAGDESSPHIHRVRGRVGSVAHECEIATGYVCVSFPGKKLWVMIKRSELSPADPSLLRAPAKTRVVAGKQLRLAI